MRREVDGQCEAHAARGPRSTVLARCEDGASIECGAKASERHRSQYADREGEPEREHHRSGRATQRNEAMCVAPSVGDVDDPSTGAGRREGKASATRNAQSDARTTIHCVSSHVGIAFCATAPAHARETSVTPSARCRRQISGTTHRPSQLEPRGGRRRTCARLLSLDNAS